MFNFDRDLSSSTKDEWLTNRGSIEHQTITLESAPAHEDGSDCGNQPRKKEIAENLQMREYPWRLLLIMRRVCMNG